MFADSSRHGTSALEDSTMHPCTPQPHNIIKTTKSLRVYVKTWGEETRSIPQHIQGYATAFGWLIRRGCLTNDNNLDQALQLVKTLDDALGKGMERSWKMTSFIWSFWSDCDWGRWGLWHLQGDWGSCGRGGGFSMVCRPGFQIIIREVILTDIDLLVKVKIHLGEIE